MEQANRDTMTYRDARARIPNRSLPDFWVGDVETLDALIRTVRRGAVTRIATTPGGRPLFSIAYGEREPITRRANFNSAVGGKQPAAYADRASRTRPVLLLVGPVHGHEVEGLTGLANLIRVMETGADLRGEPQPELRELGDACRLLIIPSGNPDGTARFEPRALDGMTQADIRFWGQGTWADDTLCGYPECKRQHPMRGPNVGFLGCYFNDAGVNPMHDEWFAPMSEEAPAILRAAREEAPDLVAVLHSHKTPPAVLRPAYIPLEVQEEVAALAARTYAHFDDLSIQHHPGFEPRAERGAPPAAFNLTSAIYHTSGAPAFTFECSHGIRDEDAYHVGCEGILEIQLGLYRSMMAHVLA
jgi:hypothetical protein